MPGSSPMSSGMANSSPVRETNLAKVHTTFPFSRYLTKITCFVFLAPQRKHSARHHFSSTAPPTRGHR